MKPEKKEGGMIVKLKENIPTILTIDDKVIKIYHIKTGGQGRIRIVADKDVLITCTHFNKIARAQGEGDLSYFQMNKK
jgi:hypothetical protein